VPVFNDVLELLMRIATYLDAQGEVGGFLGTGTICVYENKDGRWEKISVTPLSLDANMSLSEMKQALGVAVYPITQCEVFLLRELRGIFRVFLEDWGFHVWKSLGSLEEQLEQVSEQERNMPKGEPEVILPKPVGNVRNGHYRVNLIELVQSGVPQVSREILLPFFDTVVFTRLEIISDHVPRWLPLEIEEMGLRIESQTPNPKGEGTQIVIVPACGPRSCPKGRRKRNFSCNCGG
jgi:Fe-only nitrogenase accessory protein AnfO